MYARDGVGTLRESPSTISSLVLLLVLISRLITNELRVATNAYERIRFDNDSVTMSKNALARLGMSVTTQGGSGRQCVTGHRNISKYRFVLLNVYRIRET